MRRTTLYLLLSLVVAAQAQAVKKLTVEQLIGQIGSLGHQSDAQAAQKLYDLQLTERLSTNKLATFEAALPGPESRRALVALADQAEFLDPPPPEIPNQPAPNVAQQREIIAKSIDYVRATLNRLPNLFANRDTIRFEDIPPGLRDESTDTMIPYQPLHPVSRLVETVLYRDGQEIVQTGTGQQVGSASATTGMIISGEFGPIFPVVYGDLPNANLRWSRWEQGVAGLESVFRFDVPKAASHYQVEFCCIRGRLLFQEFSAYHGELTIDPANGTILRMTLIADLEKGAEIAEAELMVEYGSAELGGKKYICPVRSVSLSRAPGEIERIAPERQRILSMAQATSPNEAGEGAPLQTMINETTFDNYHLFRADAQIVGAGNSGGGSIPDAPADASSKSLKSSPATPTPQANGPSGSAVPTAPIEGAAAEGAAQSESAAPVTTQSSAASAEPPTTQVPSTAAVAVGETPGPVESKSATPGLATSHPNAPSSMSSEPEMAVVAPEPFPEKTAPLPSASGKSSYSFSVNVRLVDLDLSALNARGQPVTNLSMKDIEVYDNGRKVNLRSFSNVGAEHATQQTAVTSALPVLYSNRPDDNGPAQSATAPAAGSSTILLLDPTSLSFADLTHAREQILKFLDRIPPSELVGLYVRAGSSFNILIEQTTDHPALISALGKWIPSARILLAHRKRKCAIGSSSTPWILPVTSGTSTET